MYNAMKFSALSLNKNTMSTLFFWVVLFFMNFYSNSVKSQCAMCRAALGGEAHKAQAEAVNDGIVYLMVIPYILVAGVAYAIYRMRNNKK